MITTAKTLRKLERARADKKVARNLVAVASAVTLAVASGWYFAISWALDGQNRGGPMAAMALGLVLLSFASLAAIVGAIALWCDARNEVMDAEDEYDDAITEMAK